MINEAMHRPSTASLTLNDRYSRIYTRTASNSPVSYGSFLNAPGFNLQTGGNISWWSYEWESFDIALSANFPGIQPGDPFTVVMGTNNFWGILFQTTHHGYTYGTAGNQTYTGGNGSKQWYSTTNYNGADTVRVSGFYCCASTNFAFNRIYLLALRFGIAQSGWSAGDGNSVVGFPNNVPLADYVANYPYNFDIVGSLIPYPPGPPPE